MLKSNVINLSERQEIHVIDIPEIDKDLEVLIDDFIVMICEGDSDSEIISVKKSFLRLFKNKKDSFLMGAIAEFICHLYLNLKGYKQDFLYFNLEERSIKKGFDGVFSKSGSMFLMESKSGLFGNSGVVHKSKLKEAHKDLSDYVSGKNRKSINNPWRNAYNHASHADVGSSKTLRSKIKLLQSNYDEDKFSMISDFNIIPCSTIFLSGEWNVDVNCEIVGDHDFFWDLEGNKVVGICVTKTSYESFIEYLRS